MVTQGIKIPTEIVDKWQCIVDILAKLVKVPAALIMRVAPPYIEVFSSSHSEGNPYHVGERELLPGLYCDHVMKTKNKLLISNALEEPEWSNNPDIKLGMISYLGYPILWPTGEPFGTICVLDSQENGYNLTTEELMIRFKDLVETHIKILCDQEELKSTKAELQVINKELESFSYSVSHDLRTPLRHISGFSKLLRKSQQENLSTEDKQYYDKIDSSIAQMNHLINSLLKLSRISRTELHLGSVDITAISNDIIDDLQKHSINRTVETIIQSNLIARADEGLIHVLLSNLIGNAWKYTSNSKHALIEVGITQINSEDFFFVQDNGAGFDMKYVDDIFRPFQRLHSEKEFEGSGIGLATAQRIVHMHGGQIFAKGMVNEGAVFYFSLGK